MRLVLSKIIIQTCIMVLFTISYAYGVVKEGIPEFIIENVLDGKQDLSIHCFKSDFDFGVKFLPYKKSYFINEERTKAYNLLYCGFQWDFGKEFHIAYIHSSRDPKQCSEPHKCMWHIIPSGPCFSDASNFQYRCEPWIRHNRTDTSVLQAKFFPPLVVNVP
ncbi:hypothetical protein CsatB_025465 [Cannabis sativa]